MKILVATYCLFTVLFLFGQSPSDMESLKEAYPDRNYIIIKDEMHIDISHHKEKGVEVIKKMNRQVYLNTDQAGLYKKSQLFSSYFQRLLDVQAYSLNPVKGKNRYSKSKVKEFETKNAISEDVFYDGAEVTSFSYKGLTNGSILNFEFTQELTDPHLSFRNFFGSSHPCLNNTFTISVEDGIQLKHEYFNMDSLDVVYTREKKRKKTIYTWHADTLEVFKRENSSPEDEYFYPHIVSRIAYYENQEGEKISVLEEVKDLHNWYQKLLQETTCEDTLGLQLAIDQIVSPTDTEQEKVKKTFQWVQDNIKYIAIEDGLGGLIPADPSQVLSKRFGDCKGMSQLIVQLLEMQNITAHVAWVGTRDIPYRYEELPSPIIDNHMIAVYFDSLSNSYIFLDATDQDIAFGYPSDFIQGKEVLINLENGFEIVEVPMVPAAKSKIEDEVILSIVDNEITGIGELTATGFYAADIKSRYNRIAYKNKQKSYVKNITQKGNNKYNLTDFNAKLYENKVHFSYDFVIPDYINKTKDEIFVNMNFSSLPDFFAPYEVKDRTTPVEERYASQTHFTCLLQIPDEYELDYVPEDVEVNHELFSFQLKYEPVDENFIRYTYQIDLDYILLDLEDIPAMKALGNKMKSIDKESIVLKKKQRNE